MDEHAEEQSVLISTTWSEPEEDFDRRTYRLYLNMLLQLEWIGKILIVLFVVMFVVGMGALLLTKNFEQIILMDGSELTCLFDTETGQIRKAE